MGIEIQHQKLKQPVNEWKKLHQQAGPPRPGKKKKNKKQKKKKKKRRMMMMQQTAEGTGATAMFDTSLLHLMSLL